MLRLLAVLMLSVSLALGAVAMVPQAASATGTNNQYQHVLQKGNRGVDVKALQLLLSSHGISTSADGVFGSGTQANVKTFQGRKGLSADGIVGDATWAKLKKTVRYGSSGNAVKAAQTLIRKDIDHRGLVVDGEFGSGTRSAVRAFQSDHGLGVDGVVGPATWSKLLGHFTQHNTSHSCVAANVTSGRRWGTASAIAAIDSAGAAIKGTHGKPGIGEISLMHGGDISAHNSHERGLDVDVAPFRTDKRNCLNYLGYTWRSGVYDRAATRAYIKKVKSTGRVKHVLFNDPVLIGEGLTIEYPNHDHHLHFRFREAGNGSLYS